MDAREIIEKQLKILPKRWFDFVVSSDWKDDLMGICRQLEIEDKYVSIENQVFLVLIAVEHPNNLFLDLEEVGIETEKADKITDFANKEIFTKIKTYLVDYWQSMEAEFEEKKSGKREMPKERQSNVGNDFERIMQMREKAMQPAIVPDNLPTESQKQMHNYSGSDPYREPIE